jgi:hypothetical protein
MYYQWLLRYLRIVCDLACIAVDPQRSSIYLHDARSELKRLTKLDQPTFLVYASALKLAIDAAAGQVAAPEHWQAVLQEARHHRLGLLVIAIQWHAAHWHTAQAHTTQGRATQAHAAALQQAAGGYDFSDARQQLLDEGCLNPERLMNVILPLPHAQI